MHTESIRITELAEFASDTFSSNAMDLSSDGKTVVTITPDQKHAVVLVVMNKHRRKWSKVAEVTLHGCNYDDASVSISPDGLRVAVGLPGDDVVYVYRLYVHGVKPLTCICRLHRPNSMIVHGFGCVVAIRLVNEKYRLFTTAYCMQMHAYEFDDKDAAKCVRTGTLQAPMTPNAYYDIFANHDGSRVTVITGSTATVMTGELMTLEMIALPSTVDRACAADSDVAVVSSGDNLYHTRYNAESKEAKEVLDDPLAISVDVSANYDGTVLINAMRSKMVVYDYKADLVTHVGLLRPDVNGMTGRCTMAGASRACAGMHQLRAGGSVLSIAEW